MAIQPGASAKLYGKKVSSYGTSPAAPFVNLPFYNYALSPEQNLITPTVLGVSANRDPGAPIRDVVNVTGDVEVPIDVNNIGYWLSIMLGLPATTGTTNLTHVFKSGATTALPSFALEQAHAAVPNFQVVNGVQAGGVALNFSPSGEARARFGLVAQGGVNATTSIAGTATSNAFVPAGQFQCSISRAGSALPLTAEASLNFSNGLEPLRTIRADGKVDGFVPGITNASGALTVFFADTTLLSQATAGTSAALVMAYTVNGTQSLEINLPEVYLPVPKIVTPGPGGIRAVFNFQASYNTGQAAMMVATLKNQIASY
jgi:hypothetical protein